MEHIAAALSLSRKQLRTRVMTLTGLTPVAYVLQVRLNYARRMIVSEDTSLTTIASKCGFQNLSHFSKAFKQQFGVSPLQFRKSTDSYRQADH
jgi:AraC-like DNA-binding protein